MHIKLELGSGTTVSDSSYSPYSDLPQCGTELNSLGIYSSEFSSKANCRTRPLGHQTTQHTVVQTRAEERENINCKGGIPDHQGYPPVHIYLNFHGLAQVLQGHLSPRVFPCFTPRNSMQWKRPPVAATRTS